MPIPNDLELAIFDFDGTLVHFHHDYLFDQTLLAIDKYNHPPVSREELREHFSECDYFRFSQCDEFTAKFWAEFSWESFPAPVLFDETVTVLESLRARGVNIAIATARLSPEVELWKDLELLGIDKHIDTVSTREEGRTDWENKVPQLETIIERTGADKRTTLMVGDIPQDTTSAKESGIGTTVGVLSGGIKEHVLYKAEPDLVLPSIGHIPPYLK